MLGIIYDDLLEWGYIGPEELLRNHNEAIRKLLAGEFNAKQFEKLRNETTYPVYSFRLNKKERLLFTTHKSYLHVLEHLPTHERSTFLKLGIKEDELSKGISFTELDSEIEKPVFNAGGSKQLLYVCKELALANKVKSTWNSLGLPETINIGFSSYDQLLENNGRKQVNFDCFKSWYGNLGRDKQLREKLL